MYWKRLTDFPDHKVIGKEYNITYWKIEKNKVWHQWKKLMSADVESFEVYEKNDFIGRDKNFVYHAWTKLKKVDRDTFEEVGNSYWKDKNLIYAEYETSIKPLKGLDAKSFKYLDNGFAYDKNYAYYYGTYIRSCKQPTTLVAIKGHSPFAKDIENIYYEGGALKNADVKTWELLDNSYSKDKKSVYYTKYKLTKVDLATWEHIYQSYSKDKNRVYHMAWTIEDANPREWNKERVIEMYKNNEN